MPRDLPTQKFREWDSEVRFGFHVRNGELKGSGVLGSEGKKNFIFGFIVPETLLHTLLSITLRSGVLD